MPYTTRIGAGGASEKVVSDLGLGGDFRQVLRFLPPVTTGYSQLSHIVDEKVSKIEIPNSKFQIPLGYQGRPHVRHSLSARVRSIHRFISGNDPILHPQSAHTGRQHLMNHIFEWNGILVISINHVNPLVLKSSFWLCRLDPRNFWQ